MKKPSSKRVRGDRQIKEQSFFIKRYSLKASRWRKLIKKGSTPNQTTIDLSKPQVEAIFDMMK